MQAPVNMIHPWLAALAALIVPVATVIGIILGKANVKGENQRKLDTNCDDIAALKKLTQDHSALLAEHQMLHKGYAAMQTDVRSIRDCVIKIASKLDVEGPR